MHIMVIKRYMRKCDTCGGHEARVNKLLIKKPRGIMSAGRASIVCEQCANEPFKGPISDALSALIKPGGFFKLIYTGFMPNTCVTLPHVPLFTIICIDMT